MKTVLWAILILGFAFSVFLIGYGISGGLVKQRMLNDGWRKTYDTGTQAIRRGWLYIALGVILIVIFSITLVRL